MLASAYVQHSCTHSNGMRACMLCVKLPCILTSCLCIRSRFGCLSENVSHTGVHNLARLSTEGTEHRPQVPGYSACMTLTPICQWHTYWFFAADCKEYTVLQIHGWLLCLGWGFFIPAGIVVASFRTMTKLGSSWWYYVHVVFASAGFLATLAGIAVGCYFPADEPLMVQHKIIGIVVTAAGGLQVICCHGTVHDYISILCHSTKNCSNVGSILHCHLQWDDYMSCSTLCPA